MVMNYHALAQRYLEHNKKIYGRRINHNVKDFVKGFASLLEKQPQALPHHSAHIALITENNSHLTGGRYYSLMMAAAIKQAGLDITLYTNDRPNFIECFNEYHLPKIEVIDGHPHRLEEMDLEADLYIGSPISGNVAAIKNAKKYHKPCYVMIFDPFPMMKEFLGKDGWSGWGELISLIKTTDCNIISLCEATKPYIYDWLNKTPEQVFAIYPNINSIEKDKVPIQARQNFALFVSRIVPNKKFDHVVRACAINNIGLKVVTSTLSADYHQIIEQFGMTDRVELFLQATEAQKFELIKSAAVMINGAVFEGFGMYLAEAIDCGTPFVGYDYPSFREIRDHAGADNIYLATHNEPDALAELLGVAIKEAKIAAESDHFGFNSMVDRVNQLFRIKPKIGVIMIALNEEELIHASLISITKHTAVHKVAVVEGAVENFPTHLNFLSIDRTRQEILKAIDSRYGHKIIYEQYGRADNKAELRNRALSFLTDCNYILVVDADEMYLVEDIEQLVEEIQANATVQAFRYPFYHFWQNTSQITTGGQWDVMLPRFFKFTDKSIRWQEHELFPVNSQGIRLNEVSEKEINIHCYHFGYCKSKERVADKLEYYKKRDTNLTVTDTYSHWQPGQPTQPTHQGGVVKPFSGKLPPEIKLVL